MNHILIDYVLIDTTGNVPQPPDPSLNFSDNLLVKQKGKKFIAKRISRNY